MPDVNINAIAPTPPSSGPNTGNSGNDAVSQNGDAQNSFQQVLRDKQTAQANAAQDAQRPAGKAPEAPAAKAGEKAQSGTQATENGSQTAAKADDAQATDPVRSPEELAQMLALAGMLATNNVDTSKPAVDTAAQSTDSGEPTTDASATLVAGITAASTGKTSEQTANLAAVNPDAGQNTRGNQELVQQDTRHAAQTQDMKDAAKPQLTDTQHVETEAKPAAVTAETARDTHGLQKQEQDFASTLDTAMQNAARTAHNANTTNATQTVQAAQHTITTPVGRAGWAEEVGQRVLWTAKQDSGHAELTLTPPQLGRIEVSINLNGDQANANFVAANPIAREALQDAMPKLREMLAQSGIELGQADVSAGQSGQAGTQGDRRGSSGSSGGLAGNDVGSLQSGIVRSSQGRGLVDTFA